MQQEEFVKQLAEQGFDAPVVVEREPNGRLEHHAHPFEAKALILAGEITILSQSGEKTWRVGEVFHLQRDEPHSEFFGPEGVRYLSGRKSARP